MLNIKTTLVIIASSALAVAALMLNTPRAHTTKSHDSEDKSQISYPYDINPENYAVNKGKVGSGQSLSTILSPYGVSALMIDKIDKSAAPIFNLKNMRAGGDYLVYTTQDSLKTFEHFVYERNMTDYITISILGDSIAVQAKSKPVSLERRTAQGTISSSLWNCMIENNISPGLTMEMSDIFAWSIDFFGLQKDDSFKVIYDEKYIDTLRVGYGNIWGMEFNHAGKSYYAVPFNQDGRVTYWDEQGNSLRKNLLKAPLKYSRISSKFSYSRLHPILKIRRPHLGVDYAAPMGTPVVAVADGVITFRAYSGGGGNTLKIKHASNLTSGYLHLKSFAKGIVKGARVTQGQVVGYVGSTGMSTGPHLDFRLWRGTTPIDPLKAPSDPVEPIAEQNMEDFIRVKDRVLLELRGELTDSLVISAADLQRADVQKADTLSTVVAQLIK